MLASISLRRLVGGLLLSTLLLQSAQAQTTLNLKDADINTLITTVSEITGKNFIVDPRVKGKVTVISSTPMSSYEVYQTFLAVLQVQGFATVPAGGAIKIIPETNVGKEGSTYLGEQHLPIDEIATRVFSLKNASAVQLMPQLRPMMASWAMLVGIPNTNVLIATDRAANLDRLAKIIKDIDQAGDRDIEMVTLKNAGAADVVKTLTSLVQSDAATPEGGGTGGRKTTVLADERSNSILITGDKGDRERLRGIVDRLDTPLGEDVTTQVVYLSYASAENLAPILEGYSQLGGSSSGSSGLGSTSRTNRNTTSRNSRTTGTGTSNSSGIGGIGGNARNNGNTGIGGTTNTPATSSANVNSGGSNPDMRVMADVETNSLIITATPKLLRQATSVIRQLDIRRPQVLVDGIVAEVSADKSNQLGIDWAVYNGERIAAAGILNPTTLSALTSAATAGVSDPLVAAAGTVSQGINIGGGRIGGNNGTSFALLLKALKGDGDTNVLSQPSLMTLDNQQAEFSVGQEVPFLTGSYSNAGVGGNSGLVNPFQTIDRRDVGLTLAITPQINQGNTIQLTIDLEVSSLQSGSTGAVDLITNKRTLSNVVSVEDGQILVLSGLIDDNVSDTQRSVPYLSSIPLLGNLFKYRSVTRGRRNLMIFIRPSIVRTVADGDYYTSKKYGTLREAQMATGVNSVPLIGGKQPVLDNFETLNRNRPADAQSNVVTIPPPPSVVTIPPASSVPVPVSPTPSAESAR